jgi:hypothetical protein
MINLLVLLFTLFAPQGSKTPAWQAKDTNCNEIMTLCWYGEDKVTDPEVIAYGVRWNTTAKDEKPLEWVTEVRCLHDKRECILARNQQIAGTGTRTDIDLFEVQEWSDFQIRAIEESDYPKGQECEIDTLILNRGEGSVSLLTAPGPGASAKHCVRLMNPKTVMYTLDLKSW